MLTLLEILLIALGLIILFTGKLPRFLHDCEKHPLLKGEIQLLGATLLFPLPLALTLAMMINALFTEQSLAYFLNYTEPAALLIGLFLFVGLQSFFMKRTLMKKPETADDRANREDREYIGASFRKAYLFLLIGSFGLTAPVFLPLSWRRADDAHKTSKRVHHSEDYGRPGGIIRIVSRVLFGVYFVAVIYIAARLMTAPVVF